MFHEGGLAAASGALEEDRNPLLVGCLEELDFIADRQIERLIGEDILLYGHLAIDDGLSFLFLLHLGYGAIGVENDMRAGHAFLLRHLRSDAGTDLLLAEAITGQKPTQHF